MTTPEIVLTDSAQVSVSVITVASPVVEINAPSHSARIVEVSVIGPQGPPGAAGYTHNQPTPATTWTINHNLGFFPSIKVLDSGSQEIEGNVYHSSVNQTLIYFNPAVAGIARLT